MLPATQRILLGPGPSLMSARVMQALARPMLSHLDPQFLEIMDDVRARLMHAVYSCSQKCLGAPSGMSPIVFSPRASNEKCLAGVCIST